jgi:2-polyprenyl-6-methoxyphenol hydroxylase-like FAD-dependent oxidoreductase
LPVHERSFQYRDMAEIDVLAVGAGPTGLSLAIELQRPGLSYRLIEKNPEPARYSQALIIQARTLEQFERYGIADAAIARGRTLHAAQIVTITARSYASRSIASRAAIGSCCFCRRARRSGC